MPFHVRDAVTDTLVRKLASRIGTGLTEAVRVAVSSELKRLDNEIPLAKRLEPLIKSINRRKSPTTQTDKEFWDDLSGDY